MHSLNPPKVHVSDFVHRSFEQIDAPEGPTIAQPLTSVGIMLGNSQTLARHSQYRSNCWKLD